jgi:hypothetical protein
MVAFCDGVLRCAGLEHDWMRGPPTSSKIQMYNTLVAAPAFLTISSYQYSRP